MLLSIFPVALVGSTVWPYKLSIAVFLIVSVLSNIFAAITPCEGTLSVHFVVLPVAFVLSAVAPHVHSLSMNVVVEEFSNKHGRVSPFESPCAVLLTVLVVAFVAGPIRPGFNTIAILFVLQPFSSVLRTIDVDVGTTPVGLVVEPLAFIDITICMDQPSLVVGHIVAPVSLVLGSISPNLDAFALSEAILGPLALVHSSIVKLIGSSVDEILTVLCLFLVVFEWAELFLGVTSGISRVVRHLAKLSSIDEAVTSTVVALSIGKATTSSEFAFFRSVTV